MKIVVGQYLSQSLKMSEAEFKTYGGFNLGDVAGMHVTCPGCTVQINIHFRKDLEPHWEWDGDEDNPTVVPEIKCGKCKRKFMIDSGLIS